MRFGLEPRSLDTVSRVLAIWLLGNVHTPLVSGRQSTDVFTALFAFLVSIKCLEFRRRKVLAEVSQWLHLRPMRPW